MKISFDYDGTLDKPTIKEFAKDLITEGHDVYVITSRAGHHGQNLDLSRDVSELKIPFNKVAFTEGDPKVNALEYLEIDIHLDDDWIEVGMINKRKKTKAIRVFGNKNWRKEARKLIK